MMSLKKIRTARLNPCGSRGGLSYNINGAAAAILFAGKGGGRRRLALSRRRMLSVMALRRTYDADRAYGETISLRTAADLAISSKKLIEINC